MPKGDRNAKKQQCPAGHPLSGANLRVTPKGWRECRECHRERTRRRDAARQAAGVARVRPHRRQVKIDHEERVRERDAAAKALARATWLRSRQERTA